MSRGHVLPRVLVQAGAEDGGQWQKARRKRAGVLGTPQVQCCGAGPPGWQRTRLAVPGLAAQRGSGWSPCCIFTWGPRRGLKVAAVGAPGPRSTHPPVCALSSGAQVRAVLPKKEKLRLRRERWLHSKFPPRPPAAASWPLSLSLRCGEGREPRSRRLTPAINVLLPVPLRLFLKGAIPSSSAVSQPVAVALCGACGWTRRSWAALSDRV